MVLDIKIIIGTLILTQNKLYQLNPLIFQVIFLLVAIRKLDLSFFLLVYSQKKAMDAIFQKNFEISAELGKMQEFCLFNENVNAIVKCTKEECEIKTFLNGLKKNVFNEKLSCEERRKFFIQYSLENITVFNTMFNMQWKGKKNVERIDDLIKNTEEIVKKTKNREERLNELLAEKQEIQKRIDYLLKEITHHKDCFFSVYVRQFTCSI